MEANCATHSDKHGQQGHISIRKADRIRKKNFSLNCQDFIKRGVCNRLCRIVCNNNKNINNIQQKAKITIADLPVYKNSIWDNNKMRAIIPLELHQVGNQCHHLITTEKILIGYHPLIIKDNDRKILSSQTYKKCYLYNELYRPRYI